MLQTMHTTYDVTDATYDLRCYRRYVRPTVLHTLRTTYDVTDATYNIRCYCSCKTYKVIDAITTHVLMQNKVKKDLHAPFLNYVIHVRACVVRKYFYCQKSNWQVSVEVRKLCIHYNSSRISIKHI